MKEAELQSAVIDAAHLFGWTVAHFRPARTKGGGWVTPVAADGKGFPDLVMVSSSTIAFIELKSESGRISDAQKNWLSKLTLLTDHQTIYVEVWRPTDWHSGAIERFLRERG